MTSPRVKKGEYQVQKKGLRTLGSKLTAMALVMLTILTALALGVGYAAYSGKLENSLARTGEELSRTLASQPGLRELDPEVCRDLLDTALEWGGAERLYLIRPEGSGGVLVCAAGEVPEEDDPYLGGVPKPGENAQRLLDLFGLEGTPSVQSRNVEEDHRTVTQRRMLTRYEVLRADGSLAAYLVAELDMDGVAAARQSYLLIMGLTLGLAALALLGGYYVLIRRTVLQPVGLITARAQSYANGERGGASQLKLKSTDELAALADALRMMLVEIDLQGLEQTELTVREQRVEEELKMAAEINAAMLPKALPQGSGLGFDIRGRVEQAQEFNCSFYDYFLLDQGKLAVVVGETPGEGMSPALFTVVAKTTVNSQLRSGLSLAKALAASNRQLFEIGQGMALNALVGVLDQDGVFTYINANEQPLLMLRTGDRYDYLTGPVYAPLGQNENVAYQVQTVTLRQGERLFFHTRGLDEILNGENRTFGEQGLQAALNVSRSRRLDLDGLLGYMSAEGKAFARRPEKAGGFTTVVLEYQRSDRRLAHCDITGDTEGAAEMRAFLKRQMEENGLSRRTAAEVVVLADELLTLCLWQREPGGFLTVECAVPEEGDSVILRLKGDLGGQDPLENAAGTPAINAVEFVRSFARQVAFARSELGDVLTVEKTVDRERALAACVR